ncbi:hypothetical protein Q5752_001000 [Cryptotrichosporon argae]
MSDSEAAPSIASLRSRFESLAAASSSSAPPRLARQPSAVSSARTVSAAEVASSPPVEIAGSPDVSSHQPASSLPQPSLRPPPSDQSRPTPHASPSRKRRPPPPPVPGRSTPPSAPPDTDDERPAASVKALRNMFSASSSVPSIRSTSSTTSIPISAPSRSRTSSTAGSIPSSEGDGDTPRIDAPPRSVTGNRPAPLPPARAASPARLSPGRTTKPVLANSSRPSSAISRTPSTASLDPTRSPSGSSVGATPVPPAAPVSTSPAAITPTPTPPPTAPPQLPARRPTLPALDLPSPPTMPAGPPPLPGNRPFVAAHHAMTISASSEGAGAAPPPRLPERPRAATVSQTEAPQASTPPRLPVRQATIVAGSPHGREAAPRVDGYQPPPPPVRQLTISASAAGPSASPRRRHGPLVDGSRGDDASSEDDDDDAPMAGYSATAQKALDEYPDATTANRRPPAYAPHVALESHTLITAFAVHGRIACVGHHHVRVYDTMMSEQPLLTVDLRETGLDFRVKDPRVTAMCFRPAARTEDEGRYVWCGTKDGHLWELDVRTGHVTATKQSIHSSTVTYIFRHAHFVLTLEETGKLHVFDCASAGAGDMAGEPASDDDAAGCGPRLIRTIRTSDRLTFAKMIRGRLWTSTAPPTRSTTSAATSRGPTVRIYDPLADVVPPPLVTTTSEWAGAVTAGTVMPLAPERVYLAHEGGFVSVWDAYDATCVQVLKIGSSDIVSLEGVGERLWAGNRKGVVHVYDIAERPWVTTNLWTTDPDQPVYALYADPWSLEFAGKYTAWSCSRERLIAWDGFLAVDWIDHQMILRQPDYCTFRPIRVLVVTWNIDSAKPTDLGGSMENATFLEQCLSSVDSPDIVVFGFQEVISLTDKKLTAKTLLFGNKGKDGTAAADRVSASYRQWLEKLTYAVRLAYPPGCPYIKVHSDCLVGLFSAVFVKGHEREALKDLGITTVKRGIGGIYGNKGAIVARLVMDDTSLCFINVHLAAGQRQKAARNADLAAILEDKAILEPGNESASYVHGGDGSGILDHEVVVLNGDLNYRIDQRRDNIVASVAAGDLGFLLEHDQLRKEMRLNHAFRLRAFAEAPIAFAPTYKYDVGTDTYDSSDKRRAPAWCDRVLFRCAGGLGSVDGGDGVQRVRATSYRRYETTVSDHKPVSAGLVVDIKRVDEQKRRIVRREVGLEWDAREKELLHTLGDAYAALM